MVNAALNSSFHVTTCSPLQCQKEIKMLGIFVGAINNLQETSFGHKLTAYTANVAN